MRIALIEPGTLPAKTANSIQRMKMAQALVAVGHTVRVFAPGEDPYVSWEKFAQHYGLSHRFELEWVTCLPGLRRYDFAASVLGKARSWKADFIYTRLPQAAAWASMRGMPTVFELHDMPMGAMGPWLMLRFLHGRGARRVIANTKYLAGKLADTFGIKKQNFLIVAPNGVDLERYSNLPSPTDARKMLNFPEKFTAGYTGHLYEGRGAEFILQLAGELPEMQFLLVGGRDEDIQRVREQARDLPNVTLTGFIPNADLPRYQAAADVLIMPYSSQVAGSSGGDIAPFLNPMKMFEYLAAGRPIISSDLPILREILTQQNAIILLSEDMPAWVAALRELQANPAKRATLAADARHTAEQFAWEERAQRIFQGL